MKGYGHMRTTMTVTAAIVLMVAGTLFMLKSNTSATQQSQTTVSIFELMSNAKDLPVAPNPDAI